MTHLQQIERDLDAALDDAVLLARQQISASFRYLAEAQNFTRSEISALVAETLSEIDCPEPVDMTLRVVAGTRHHLVN